MKRYLVLLIVITSACGEPSSETEPENKKLNSTSINESQRDIAEIQKEIFSGDTNAYLELRNIYLDSFSGDFLYWAIFMSNKHNYSKAHLDVYYSLIDSYIGGDLTRFNEIDKNTQSMIFSYLNKAISSGEKEAELILDKIEKGSDE